MTSMSTSVPRSLRSTVACVRVLLGVKEQAGNDKPYPPRGSVQE